MTNGKDPDSGNRQSEPEQHVTPLSPPHVSLSPPQATQMLLVPHMVPPQHGWGLPQLTPSPWQHVPTTPIAGVVAQIAPASQQAEFSLQRSGR